MPGPRGRGTADEKEEGGLSKPRRPSKRKQQFKQTEGSGILKRRPDYCKRNRPPLKNIQWIKVIKAHPGRYSKQNQREEDP